MKLRKSNDPMGIPPMVLIKDKRLDEGLKKFKEYRFEKMECDGLGSNLAIVCYIISFFISIIAINCFIMIMDKFL